MVRSVRLVLVALVAASSLAAGCSVSLSSNTGAGAEVTSPPAPVHPYEPDASDAGYAASLEPAESAAVSAVQGNPLCNASPYVGGCYPDLPVSCGLATDGGDADLAIDDGQPLACHVQSVSDGGDAGVEPVCVPAGAGIDGNACLHGTDCAAGFECVQNVCRHYCCSGNGACSLADFCDIEPTTDAPGTLVPVCVPLVPCQLLALDGSPGGCAAGDSCEIVRDDGTTSCETVGSAEQGASCNSQHCAAGLVCLGPAGSRNCYTLCYTATMAECNASQQCAGGLPLFPDPAVGWCQ
jgi:hypothetical protein